MDKSTSVEPQNSTFTPRVEEKLLGTCSYHTASPPHFPSASQTPFLAPFSVDILAASTRKRPLTYVDKFGVWCEYSISVLEAYVEIYVMTEFWGTSYFDTKSRTQSTPKDQCDAKRSRQGLTIEIESRACGSDAGSYKSQHSCSVSPTEHHLD